MLCSVSLPFRVALLQVAFHVAEHFIQPNTVSHHALGASAVVPVAELFLGSRTHSAEPSLYTAGMRMLTWLW